jgi:hypothetical protein
MNSESAGTRTVVWEVNVEVDVLVVAVVVWFVSAPLGANPEVMETEAVVDREVELGGGVWERLKNARPLATTITAIPIAAISLIVAGLYFVVLKRRSKTEVPAHKILCLERNPVLSGPPPSGGAAVTARNLYQPFLWVFCL